MARAVRFDRYGDESVLYLADVSIPEAANGQVVVRVRTAGVSTGEAKIRDGSMDKMAPAHFPEGEGTEFAGVVHAVGAGVTGIRPGDPVIGFADIRGAQADYVPAPTGNVLPKPDALDWDAAAALVSPGATATSVLNALKLQPGETVVVAGASGGVGVVVVQLAVRAGARVIATASEPNHEFLRGLGAEPVAYGDGLEDRIRAITPDGVDAFADCHGNGNLAVAQALGVPTDRMNTIADFPTAGSIGAKTDGMYQLDDIRAALVPFAYDVALGSIKVPIKDRFPLEQVQDAYRRLTEPGGIGRVVLTVSQDSDGG